MTCFWGQTQDQVSFSLPSAPTLLLPKVGALSWSLESGEMWRQGQSGRQGGKWTGSRPEAHQASHPGEKMWRQMEWGQRRGHKCAAEVRGPGFKLRGMQ